MNRYLVRDKMCSLPIQLRKGDVINAKEVFGIKAEKESCRVEEIILRKDSEGLYYETYLMGW